jgi:hypothetical protein
VGKKANETVARLKILVVVLGLIIVGMVALLVILLAARANAPLVSPTPGAPAAPPAGVLPSRTMVGLVAILSGGGCLIVVGGILAWVYVWNRRAGARRTAAPPDPAPPVPPPGTPPA